MLWTLNSWQEKGLGHSVSLTSFLVLFTSAYSQITFNKYKYQLLNSLAFLTFPDFNRGSSHMYLYHMTFSVNRNLFHCRPSSHVLEASIKTPKEILFCKQTCLFAYKSLFAYKTTKSPSRWLCGHLLGKGWPLGSRLWCLLWVCHFPFWYPGSGVVLVEQEMSVFWDDHALPDTSMRLSDYVLQTFLVNIFSLAIAIFSFFKMANGNFKMAAKFIC